MAEGKRGQALVEAPSQEYLVSAFEASFAGAYAAAEESLRRHWDQSRDRWVRLQFGKSRSEHTLRAYQSHTGAWMAFLAGLRNASNQPVSLWEAEPVHVDQWIRSMETAGLSAATIAAKLSACSSWYSYVIRDTRIVRGIERCGFFDAQGRPKMNPFRGNVSRPKVSPYGRARALPPVDVSRLLDYLEGRAHTVTGARNYALLLTFLMTGYRTHEVIGMRWGDIQPAHSRPGSYVIRWRGKRAKEERDAFPGQCYDAIRRYVELEGRRSGNGGAELGREDYIWRPLRVDGLANFRHIDDRTAAEWPVDGHISGKAVHSVLQNALRRAGVANPALYSNHSLRHTFARTFRHRVKDLESLRQRLHHTRLDTTSIYARDVLDEPVDDWSDGLLQELRGG